MLFTDADTKAFVLAALVQAPDALKTHELISGGLILESHACGKIRRIIFDGEDVGRISLLQLVTETKLELKKVEALLPPVDEGEWGRVGISSLVGKKEFVALKEDVKRLLKEGKVFNVADYCQEKTIDQALFRKILGQAVPALEIHWEGQDRNMVCTTALYDLCKKELQTLLEEATSPVQILTLLAERDLPSAFVTQLVNIILREQEIPIGVTEGSLYTPRVYTEERQTALVNRLHSESMIDIESLRREGVQDVERFILDRSPDSHILEMHIVTEEYLAALMIEVRKSILAEGWAEVTGLEMGLSSGDEKRLLSLVWGRLLSLQAHGRYLMSPNLHAALTQKSTSYAIQSAELIQPTEGSVPPQLKWKDLLSHLSTTSSVPVPVLTSFMGDLHSSATSEYNGHIIQLRNAALKSAQDIFIDKCYARVRIHQIAIKELTDAGLRAKLTADLVDFARELVGTQLSKLEIAIRVNGIIDIALEPLFDLRTIIQALVVGPSKVKPEVQLKTINENIAKFMEAVFEYRESAELLLSKKDELLSDLEGQLQKTNEPSLALTLALVIIHAKLSYGVLKASGKYVPKLLKQLQGKIDSETYDVLVKKKDVVISRSAFKDEDFVELRQIVGNVGN